MLALSAATLRVQTRQRMSYACFCRGRLADLRIRIAPGLKDRVFDIARPAEETCKHWCCRTDCEADDQNVGYADQRCAAERVCNG